MNVPFFDLHRLYLEQKEELDHAIAEATGSGWYILGKIGQRFEKELATFIGEKTIAIGCNSGTDALVLSLKAADVGAGDEVIAVSHTAIPTLTAICSIGARPVCVDIDEKTWVMDLSQALAAVTARTRAIIPVHLYGNTVDIAELRKGLDAMGRSDIAIVEDVAQAFGAKFGNRYVGTTGEYGALSFYPTKNIGALGDAGGILCKTEAQAEKLLWLRNYGQRHRYHADIAGGINSRLDEIQAAVLSVRLGKLREWNARKDRMMAHYQNSLTDLPLQFQAVGVGGTPAWHLCVIAVRNRETRDGLIQFLEGQGIQALVHYPFPTHTQPAFREFTAGVSLPVTESLAGRIVSLPLNPCLTASEQDSVIASVKQFLGNNRD